MKAASKHLPLLRLPGRLDTEPQNEPMEILAASHITRCMLWPEAAEERSRGLYMALVLQKIHEILLETQKEQAHALFTSIVEEYFGGWQQYSRNLILVNFPSQGKGSITERNWQGRVAGMVFLHAFRNAISLSAAAKEISEVLYNAPNPEDFDDLSKPAPENIMKNYWPRFQHVAHFWAALRYFVAPEPTDSIIRLDKAIPSPDVDPRIRHGWRGVMDMAHSFLELSVDAKRYKTHKPLLDQEVALRVIFTE